MVVKWHSDDQYVAFRFVLVTSDRTVALSLLDTNATTGLGRFDKVVKLAEQKGLKLIVALTNNCAFRDFHAQSRFSFRFYAGADYGGA